MKHDSHRPQPRLRAALASLGVKRSVLAARLGMPERSLRAKLSGTGVIYVADFLAFSRVLGCEPSAVLALMDFGPDAPQYPSSYPSGVESGTVRDCTPMPTSR